MNDNRFSPHDQGNVELLSGELLPPIVWDVDDFIESGPVVALQLRLDLGANADRTPLPRQLAELLRSISDREIALGGDGMILDREASSVHAGGLTLVMRTLDVRDSKTRLEQLADEVSTGGTPVSSSVETVPDEGLLDQVVTEMANPTENSVHGAMPTACVGVTARILVHATSKRGQVL